MNTPTKAHDALACYVTSACEAGDYNDAAQLIADSEANALEAYKLAHAADFEVFHAMRMKLTTACGDPLKLHDEALDAIIAERDQLRAELANQKVQNNHNWQFQEISEEALKRAERAEVRCIAVADSMRNFAAANYPPNQLGLVDFVRVVLEGYAQELTAPEPIISP